jgi:hypothetical protein
MTEIRLKEQPPIPYERQVEVVESLSIFLGNSGYGRHVPKGSILDIDDPIVQKNIEANPAWFRRPARPIETREVKHVD